MKLPAILLVLVVMNTSQAIGQTGSDEVFTDVDTSRNQICALRATGEVVCSVESRMVGRLSVPDDLPALTDITVGQHHACGLSHDGAAHCWGENDFGQLDLPVGGVFKLIEAGTNHTCAIQVDGIVQCWGDNGAGQSTPRFFEPVSFFHYPGLEINQPSSMVALSLATDRSCGLDSEGVIQCWGNSSTIFRPLDIDSGDAVDTDKFVLDLALLDDYGIVALLSNGQIVSGSSTISSLFLDKYSHIESFTTLAICARKILDSSIECHYEPTAFAFEPHILTFIPDTVDLQLNSGDPLQSILGGGGSLCGFTFNGSLRCAIFGIEQRRLDYLYTPGTESPALAAPENLRYEVYSDSTIEFFWTPNSLQLSEFPIPDWAKLDAYQTHLTGAEIYRDDELLATTTQFSSYIDDTLEPGRTYHYRVRYIPSDPHRNSLFSNSLSVRTSSVPLDSSPLTVSGNVISWNDDGWYQVQIEETYTEVCGGGNSCTVEPGTYVVINHTTGARYGGIVIVDEVALNGDDVIEVHGNTISWPDDGWYQVQNEATFSEVCGGGSNCSVEAGSYLVINHSTGARFPGIVVGEGSVVEHEGIVVSGNTISWPDDGWYQVQDETTLAEVCSGGSFCTVEPGVYLIINHDSGERFSGVRVGRL